MANYTFTEKAEQDLEDIVDYTLEQWGVIQTHTYIDGLEERGQLLADNPALGTPRPSLHDGLFSFPYESHVLYYVKRPRGIAIIRVLHQNMDPIRHL